MPKSRKSDDPNALTEHLGVMITKAELGRILAVAHGLGITKSAAARIVLRAGLDSEKVKSFTPQETDNS